MIYVYALYSRGYDKIYIGFSSDLVKRLISHNHPENRNWTRQFQPWELIYKEVCQSKRIAIKREKQLKSFQGREFIRSLITK